MVSKLNNCFDKPTYVMLLIRYNSYSEFIIKHCLDSYNIHCNSAKFYKTSNFLRKLLQHIVTDWLMFCAVHYFFGTMA